MNRALTLLLAVAALLVLASPSAAAPYTITKSGTTLTVTMDADGGSIEYDACANGFIFGTCDDYKIRAGDGFNTVPSGCTDTDGDPAAPIRELDCNPRPARTVINASESGDSITANCDFLGDGSALTLSAKGGNDNLKSNCDGAEVTMGAGNDTATSGRGSVAGEDGDDDLSSGFIFGNVGTGLTLTGGPGRDRLAGTQLGDKLEGGPDNDRLEGFTGADELRGDAGRDLLSPGAGTDPVISGGEGTDTAIYEDVTSDQGISLSLNGVADDGAPEEKDNIGTDVENIEGSPSPDTVTGTDGVNLIDTDTGNDNIDPGKANDFVTSGSGDDTIHARDGAIDAIDCGEGNDKVTSDEFDNVTACETNDKSRELMPDVDNDGVAAPTDCDDRNPARRPGLPDKPGNGVDEDCANGDAPYLRIVTGVQSLFRAGAVTRIGRLKLVDVPAGATVSVRCKRKRKACFATRSATLPKGAGQLDIRKRFRLARVKLKPGSTLEVRITNADSIGKVVQYPIRRRKVPVSRLRCLPPGARSPRRC